MRDLKGKLNCFLENKSKCSHVCLNKEGLIIRRTKFTDKCGQILKLKIWTSDFSSGPVDFSVPGPDGPVAINSYQKD